MDRLPPMIGHKENRGSSANPGTFGVDEERIDCYDGDIRKGL